jgi:hypothetical protein
MSCTNNPEGGTHYGCECVMVRLAALEIVASVARNIVRYLDAVEQEPHGLAIFSEGSNHKQLRAALDSYSKLVK